MTFLSKQERQVWRQAINSRKLYIGTLEYVERDTLLAMLARLDELEEMMAALEGSNKVDAAIASAPEGNDGQS